MTEWHRGRGISHPVFAHKDFGHCLRVKFEWGKSWEAAVTKKKNFLMFLPWMSRSVSGYSVSDVARNSLQSLTLGFMDILDGGRGGSVVLSLWDCQKHPWLRPIRCQEKPLPQLGQLTPPILQLSSRLRAINSDKMKNGAFDL